MLGYLDDWNDCTCTELTELYNNTNQRAALVSAGLKTC